MSSECVIGFLPWWPPRVRMSLEVQLATSSIGYVRVQLGGGEIGMAEHFLNAAKVGAAFEEVRRKGVAQQVRVDSRRLQARAGGETAQDQERAGPGERSSLGVEEELGAVAAVEVRAAAGEIAAQRLGGPAADRDDPLLVALAQAADEPVVERDRALVERDGLGDAEAGAVEELDQGAVAEVARLRASGCLDQAFGLAGRQRPGQLGRRRGRSSSAAGLSVARAEQLLVAEEGANRRGAASDRAGARPAARSSAR